MLKEVDLLARLTTWNMENASLVLFNKRLDKAIFTDHTNLYVSYIAQMTSYNTYSLGPINPESLIKTNDLIYYAHKAKDSEVVIFDVKTEEFTLVKIGLREIDNILKNRNSEKEYWVFTKHNTVIRVVGSKITDKTELKLSPNFLISRASGFYALSDNELISYDQKFNVLHSHLIAKIVSVIYDKDELIVLIDKGKSLDLRRIKDDSNENLIELSGNDQIDLQLYETLVNYIDVARGTSSTCVMLYKIHSNGQDNDNEESLQIVLVDLNSREKMIFTIDGSIQKPNLTKISSVIIMGSNQVHLSGYYLVTGTSSHGFKFKFSPRNVGASDSRDILSNPGVQRFINLEAMIGSALLKQLADQLLERAEIEYYLNNMRDIRSIEDAIRVFWIPVVSLLINTGMWIKIKNLVDYRGGEKDGDDYALRELENFFNIIIEPIIHSLILESQQADVSQIDSILAKFNNALLVIETVYNRKLREAKSNKIEQKFEKFLYADEQALENYNYILGMVRNHVLILKLRKFVASSSFSYKHLKYNDNTTAPFAGKQTDKMILNDLLRNKKLDLNKQSLVDELAHIADPEIALDLVLYTIVAEIGPYAGPEPFDQYLILLTNLPFYENLQQVVQVNKNRLSNIISWTMLDHLSQLKNNNELLDYVVRKSVHLLDQDLTPESIRFIVIQQLAALNRKSEILMLLNDKSFIRDRENMEKVLVLLIDLDLTKNAFDTLVEYNTKFTPKIGFADFLESAKSSKNFNHILSLNLPTTEKHFLAQMLNRPENAELKFVSLIKQQSYEQALSFYESHRDLLCSESSMFFANLLKIKATGGFDGSMKGSNRMFMRLEDTSRNIIEEHDVSIHDRTDEKPSHRKALGLAQGSQGTSKNSGLFDK